MIEKYDKNKISVGTLCSHSALQIFHGARKEGFKTIGITTKERMKVYESFPLGKPDEFLIVNNFKDLESNETQEKLIEKNCVLVPHGSFIAYLNNLKKIKVPFFGNKKGLIWESNRLKQEILFREAGVNTPRNYNLNELEDEKIYFVKFHGAKGGSGYFLAKGRELKTEIKKRDLNKDDVIIQNFLIGVRYYPHFFYSPILDRLELLSIDKRIETIDEIYRGLNFFPKEFQDYTVSGNIPVVLRESLLKEILEIGQKILDASRKLFPPGIIGPFCLETVYHPRNGFTVFEASLRIVAGTNLFIKDSPYSVFYFDEEMSMGRRIVIEIKKAIEKNCLEKILSC